MPHELLGRCCPTETVLIDHKEGRRLLSSARVLRWLNLRLSHRKVVHLASSMQSRLESPILLLLQGFHGLHELQCLSEQLSSRRSLDDCTKLLVQLIQSLRQVGILVFFRQVHEQVKDSILTRTVESLL